MQQEVADLSITLVKNTLDQLPIRPETHKNIRLYIIEGEKNGIYKSDDTVEHNLVSILEDRGFNVTVNDGSTRVKGKTLEYRDNVDLDSYSQISLDTPLKITIASDGQL